MNVVLDHFYPELWSYFSRSSFQFFMSVIFSPFRLPQDLKVGPRFGQEKLNRLACGWLLLGFRNRPTTTSEFSNLPRPTVYSLIAWFLMVNQLLGNAWSLAWRGTPLISVLRTFQVLKAELIWSFFCASGLPRSHSNSNEPKSIHLIEPLFSVAGHSLSSVMNIRHVAQVGEPRA